MFPIVKPFLYEESRLLHTEIINKQCHDINQEASMSMGQLLVCV